MRQHTPQDVVEICEVLARSGFQAWIVGGAVRDALMGKTPHDWDIATNATPDVVQRIFPRTFPTGIEHGTITVRHNHESYEVTTFRGDGSYTDGRRPDGVTFKNSIEEDLARRDFTINAIAYDPLADRFADPFRGLEDIQNGVLRAVGNAEQRFSEDGLRCLRAARFAATLEFSIHSDTLAAIPLTVESYRAVSAERVRDEWLKAMKASKPSVAFQVMLDTGILGNTVPEILEMVGCKQNRYHEHDVWGHTMSVLDNLPADDEMLRVTGLLHDIAKPRTRCFCEEKQDYTFYEHEDVGAEMSHEICNRLRFSVEHRTRICHLVKNHLILYSPDWQDKAVRRWVNRVTPEHLDSLYTLALADIAGKGDAKTPMDSAALFELRDRVKALESAAPTPTGIKSLAINGTDLMSELGVPQGPRLGAILKTLLTEVVDNPEINTREGLLARARVL